MPKPRSSPLDEHPDPAPRAPACAVDHCEWTASGLRRDHGGAELARDRHQRREHVVPSALRPVEHDLSRAVGGSPVHRKGAARGDPVWLDTSPDRVGHAADVRDDRRGGRLRHLRPGGRAARGGTGGGYGEQARQQRGSAGQDVCHNSRGGGTAAVKAILEAQEALSLPTAYGVSCRARAERAALRRRAPCQSGMRSIRFAPADERSTPVRAVPPFPAGACSLPAEIRLAYVKRGSINMGPGAQLLAQVLCTTRCGALLRRLSLPAGLRPLRRCMPASPIP